jgi:hypothetical protein|tara:strand:- start:1003 stop:1185 length:183 start_codon:yes stop_codon:yes gene_type:complete
MNENFWEKERKIMYYSLIKEYQEEGYNLSEAKALAKKESDEAMIDKESFVSEIWDNSYEE